MKDIEPEVTRRGAVGLVTAIGAITAGASIAVAQAQAAAKTFVLVHGAWHGSWCWRRVADRLERMGHKVFAPTLTGLCERSHLLSKDVSLATHTADVVNLVKWEGLEDIILVGHSYAGIVVTQVAEQIGPSVASLVLLDAFYPQPGDSLVTMGSPAVQKLVADGQARGEIAIKPIPAAVFNVNEKDRAWVDAQCTPHPIATFVDKVTSVGGREKVARKTYIRAKGYNSAPFDAALAKIKTDRTWKTYEVPAGHDVMIDMPDRLVEILLEVG